MTNQVANGQPVSLDNMLVLLNKVAHNFRTYAQLLKLESPVVYHYESNNSFTREEVFNRSKAKEVKVTEVPITGLTSVVTPNGPFDYAVVVVQDNTEKLGNGVEDFGGTVLFRVRELGSGKSVYHAFSLGNKGTKLLLAPSTAFLLGTRHEAEAFTLLEGLSQEGKKNLAENYLQTHKEILFDSFYYVNNSRNPYTLGGTEHEIARPQSKQEGVKFILDLLNDSRKVGISGSGRLQILENEKTTSHGEEGALRTLE